MTSNSGHTTLPCTEGYARARTWLADQGDRILADQVEIARTPAPPFEERDRAELVADRLGSLALDIAFDDAGNLIARDLTRASDRRPVIVAAHLDTVFGPETPIEVRRSDERWVGAGIADNARGLAVAISVLHALSRCDAPDHPIVFAFTVGEEGTGDLRGTKHLFRTDGPFRDAEAFIALDGTGLSRIVHRALGSRRYRFAIRGPGGHSWTDYGRPNPAHVVAELVYRLSHLALPGEPRTTLTIARLGGGTSVNSIPSESWVEIDLRSESSEKLERVERSVHQALSRSIAGEERRASPRLDADVQVIGRRPVGSLRASHPLVMAARDATLDLGIEPELATSSTDANVPLALGIPAIAVGAGGLSGEAHTEGEWFEDTDGAAGAIRLLSILAAVSGL